MSRIRSIKPEWNDDEKLHMAGLAARTLSVSLIAMADDYGNGRANVRMLGARCFWAEPDPVACATEAISKLANMGYVELYEVRGESYFHLANWEKHQRVDNAGKPLVPGPDEAEDANDSGDVHRLSVISPRDAASGGEMPLDQDQDQDHDQEQEHDVHRPGAANQVGDVFDHWVAETGRDPSRTKLTSKRRKRIQQRLRDGYSVDDLKLAITGIARSPFHRGQNDAGKRYDTIDLVLRSPEKVEEWREHATSPGRTALAKGVAAAAPSEAFTDDDPDDVWGEEAAANG